MSLVQVKCPSCGVAVWVSLGSPCPSCRKQVPADLLETAAKEKGVDLTAAPQPQPSRPAPRLSGVMSSPAAEQNTPNRRSVVQTQWWAVVFGVLLILLSGSLFFVGGDVTTSRQTRQGRAVENLLGKEGSKIFFCLGGVALGMFLIYASQVTKTEAIVTEDTVHTCDLCGKSPPGNGEAFISVWGGGAKEFTAAFRCHSCEGCLKTASRLAGRFNLQFSLMMLMIIPTIPLLLVPLVFVLKAIAPSSSDTAPKPGAAMFFAICFGIAVLLAAAVVALNFHVSRGTARLLGPRLDPVIRSVAGVRSWRWPRSISMSRQVAAGQKIIDLS